MQGRENFTISIRAYRRTEATISARNFNREGEREGGGERRRISQSAVFSYTQSHGNERRIIRCI